MKKNILYLYCDLMPYVLVPVREFVKSGYNVHIIKWSNNLLTPYVPPIIDHVTYYDRNMLDKNSIIKLVESLNPSAIFVCGWIDTIYLDVCRSLKNKTTIPIIAFSDTQWSGNKQWFNVLFRTIRHKKWFSKIFVAGYPQIEYAKKLGFNYNDILVHHLCADVDVFAQVDIDKKKKEYPKRLLFVGRFAHEKGLMLLLNAWQAISHMGWTLTLVGNGPLKDSLLGYEDVEVKDFMSQEELVEEAQNSGIFILPSLFEPWALVIHEFAASGLPILSSSCVGANSIFLINGFNGYSFESNNPRSLISVLSKMLSMQDDELLRFSYNSRLMSNRITPQLVAANMLSVLS